jgi:hypothetical protein
MKKSIIRALCLVLMLLSVALALGCAAGGKHTYDNILDTYRQLLTKAQNGESIPADGEDNVLNALYAIARTCEPAEMGYATCDFDGNGEVVDDFEISLPAEFLNYIRNLILKVVNIVQRILGL